MTRLFAGTPFDIPPTCDLCGNQMEECACTPEEKAEADRQRQREADRLPPESQTARVQVQKRKGGRVVTAIEGLTAKANDLPALLRQLQARCGSGGSVKAKEDRIEIQGDHVDAVRETLREIGYRLK